MSIVRSALDGQEWDSAEVAAAAADSIAVTSPFDDESVSFCTAMSRALLSGDVVGPAPELVPLGYWLRRASVERMRETLFRLRDDRTLLVPRGLVLHVTPANVDTMFVYSWVLALLTGNSSVVRISDRAGVTTETLLRVIAQLGTDFGSVRNRTWIVRTGHDDEFAKQLSAVADVRIVWGGDSTVDHFRRFPLPPRGRDVMFPNRHSLAILDAEAVREADDRELAAIGGRFFNDAYWFDQGGCSSPRLLVWRANSKAAVADARQRLRSAVTDALAARRYRTDPGMAIEKMVYSMKAAAGSADVRIHRAGNEATWVELPNLDAYDRESCGGGIFFEVVVDDLAPALARFVGHQDQTCAHWGLARDELVALARHLNGRGIDRFVPLGRALEFESLWDGFDLTSELVKRVVIDA